MKAESPSLISTFPKRKLISGSLDFFTQKDVPSGMNLLIHHFILEQKINKQQLNFSNIQTHLQKFLRFAAEKNTSFVSYFLFTGKIIKQNNIGLVGICINLDIKDLIQLFQTSINLNVFANLGIFNGRIKNWVYKLGNSMKGEYLFNVYTVFYQQDYHWINKVQYICKGMGFCKIVGWKNIIYPTNDPFLFVKLGGQVFDVIKNQTQYSNLHTEQQIIQNSQIIQHEQQNLLLKIIIPNRLTYMMVINMHKLKLDLLYGEKIGKSQIQIFEQIKDGPIAKGGNHFLLKSKL